MLQGFSPRFPHTAAGAAQIEKIRADALDMLKTPCADLPYTAFRIYSQTGSRTEYEELYMRHRKRLWVLAAMAMWEDDDRWVDGLCDTVGAICGENIWAFPAHVTKCVTYEQMRHDVDLFAAETAGALAETAYLLGDRLPPVIIEMIRENVTERVIVPFSQGRRKYGKNNWSAVCCGSVAMAIIELGLDDYFEICRDRIVGGLNYFLESYYDDGCCMEGVLYWSYGFGYFVYAAAMLREYTHGNIDLLSTKKAAAIAAFAHKAFFEMPHTVPFADAPHLLYLNPGLMSFLRSEYGIPALPDAAAMTYGADIRWRFADMIRNFFWSGDITQCKETKKRGTDFFSDACWLIHRGERFSAAIKGGHNGEPHNHNDVGTFVLYSAGKYIADDLGWPEYYKSYFGAERYNDICASSRGHSVPELDGHGQLPGRERCAKLLERSEGGLTLDLSAAYGEEDGVLIRDFAISEDGITVTDTVAPTHTLVQTVVTRCVPELTGRGVRINGFLLEAGGDCDIGISTEQFHPRNSIGASDMKQTETAYLIHITPPDGALTLRMTLRTNI